MKSSDHTTPEMGRVIALARRARGMTLRQLGERLGVSAQAVHKWERGVNYPDITQLPMIARVLEVSIEDLFG